MEQFPSSALSPRASTRCNSSSGPFESVLAPGLPAPRVHRHGRRLHRWHRRDPRTLPRLPLVRVRPRWRRRRRHQSRLRPRLRLHLCLAQCRRHVPARSRRRRSIRAGIGSAKPPPSTAKASGPTERRNRSVPTPPPCRTMPPGLRRNVSSASPRSSCAAKLSAPPASSTRALHWAFDYEFWIRLSRIGPFQPLPVCLAVSRMHRANKTLGSRRQVFQENIRHPPPPLSICSRQLGLRLSQLPARRPRPVLRAPAPLALVYLASLPAGSYYNAGSLWRYWKEWLSRLFSHSPTRPVRSAQ